MATNLERIRFRRDTAANWASSNPVLAMGEPGLEIDTGKFKLGNGTTAWLSLPELIEKTAALAADPTSELHAAIQAIVAAALSNDPDPEPNPNQAVTFASLESPVSCAHRGAGPYFAQDNAISSVDYAISVLPRSALMIDCDVQATSDGVPVLMHDDTVDRLTNGTGAVSSMTVAQYQALFLRDIAPNDTVITTEHPATFSQFLDRMASSGAVGSMECKPNDVTVAQKMVDMIVARGFQSRVLFSSVYAANLAPAKAAGMRVMLAQSGSNILTASQIATCVNGGPPTDVSYDYTNTTACSDAWLSSLIGIGIKNLWPYTFKGRRSNAASEMARLASLGATSPGYFSDDGIYTGRHNPTKLATDAQITRYDHGMIQSYYGTGTDDSLSAAKRPYPSGGWMKYDGGSANGQYMHFGAMALPSAPSKIDFTVRFDKLGSTASSRFAVLWAGMTTDAPVGTTATANRGVGYTVLLRESGAMGIYKVNNPTGGAGSTSLVSGTSTALTTGQIVPCSFEFLSDGNLRFTRLDTGVAITTPAPDTTYRGGYFSLGKNSSDNIYSFKDVVVTP